jgi:hypothetical protein
VIWPAWMGIPIRPTKVYAATDLFNSHRPDQVAHNRQYALPRPLSQVAHMCRYVRAPYSLGSDGGCAIVS